MTSSISNAADNPGAADIRTEAKQDLDHVREAASAARADVGDSVRTGVDTLKDKARDGIELAKTEAANAAESAKNDAAARTSTVADALKGMADNLDENGQPQAAGLTRNAAARIDRFAADIRDRPVGDLVGDVEDFARRNPALVIGGAALAGFAIARFLKSSAEARDEAERMTANDIYAESHGSLPQRSYDPYRSTRR